jgi:predicted nucleic acid-binding protein
MRPVLLDSSIYISALRQGEEGVLSIRRLADDAPIWLSAVVLEELYAGADDHERKLVQSLERDFEKIKRILVPILADWIETGVVLGRLAAKYGYERIRQARLTNDALIAMSARRMGICVITSNERDFQRLAEFREFKFEVATV